MEVAGNSPSGTDDSEPPDQPERFDLELLAVGKRMGLSFDEMNLLRVRDLIDFVNAYTAGFKKGDDEETVREATQEDIDNF